MSRISKIAAQTASAEANRPTTTNGIGTSEHSEAYEKQAEPEDQNYQQRHGNRRVFCATISDRVWLSLVSVLNACDCRNRWPSLWGANS